MSPQLRFHFLCFPQFEIDHKPIQVERRKVTALLAYLAMQPGLHARDELSCLLWPDYDQVKAFANLRHTVWEIQEMFGEGWLLNSREKIGLNPEAETWLDVRQFETILTDGRTLNDRLKQIKLLEEAVQLYRSSFLTSFSLKDAPAFNDWTSHEAHRLEGQLSGALGILCDDYIGLHQAGNTVPHAARLVALDPLNEVSQRKLMEVYAQAGQISAALIQYKTCEQLLRKELGLDPQPETIALYRQIRNVESARKAVEKPAKLVIPTHNLPAPISSFIGRQNEQAEITRLIARHRLVTLAGPGGVGKTRLAIKVGGALIAEFPQGVWLAELAAVTDPVLLPQTIAGIFGLANRASVSYTQLLINYLKPKNTLLILDNCEQILDVCAQLIDTLLKNCPQLKILTTSREVIGITGEAVYPVPSLEFPDLQQILEKLQAYESVRLFEERAQLVITDFVLAEDNIFAVAQICRLLGGIPLALELAAARINLFSPQEIAAKLSESLKLLTMGSRTALPRHQTIRASMDWSWDLLSDPEKVLLRRLSIFSNGWIMEAAEAICSDLQIAKEQIPDLLTQLVQKSLVALDQRKMHAGRYRFHEIVRQYGREKLSQTGEEEALRRKHLDYYLEFALETVTGLNGYQKQGLFARTCEEVENLRSAMDWAQNTNVEAGLYLAAYLWGFWESMNNINECAVWLEKLFQKPEAQNYPHARAKALWVLSIIQSHSGQYEIGRQYIQECLDLSRKYGTPTDVIDSLVVYGLFCWPSKAVDMAKEALAIAREFGIIDRQAWVLNNILFHATAIDPDYARQCFEESIRLSPQVSAWRLLAATYLNAVYWGALNGDLVFAQECMDKVLHFYHQFDSESGTINKISMRDALKAEGLLAYVKGDYEQARSYTQKSADLCKELGIRSDYNWMIGRLGYIALKEGKLDEAQRMLSETVDAFQHDNDFKGVVYTLEGVSGLMNKTGHSELAAKLIGWTDAVRMETENKRSKFDQQVIDQEITTSLAKIGQAVFEKAYQDGRSVSMLEGMKDLLWS